MLQQLPAGSLDDLKPGSMAVVTSTRGSHPGSVTGIMVIANVERLVQMAQSQAPGESPMEALNRMHGGMLGGPNGFSLPGDPAMKLLAVLFLCATAGVGARRACAAR